MATYPVTCQQLTSGCAPAVEVLASLAVDLKCATVANLTASAADLEAASLGNLFLGSGALGTVTGSGAVTTEALAVQGAAELSGTLAGGATSFGSLAQPTATLLAGVGLQPHAVLLTTFVSYTVPRDPPHLTLFVAISPMLAGATPGTLYLPDAPSYAAPFPPLGYRLAVVNLDQATSFNVASAFATVTGLSGVAPSPAKSMAVASNLAYTYVWTGATWLYTKT